MLRLEAPEAPQGSMVMQMMSAQGTLYDCMVREDHRLVLIGVVRHREGVVAFNSPLPARLKDRLSGRLWSLDYVDRVLGLRHYLPA